MPALLLNTIPPNLHISRPTTQRTTRHRCQASNNKNNSNSTNTNDSSSRDNFRPRASSWVVEYDLYELLGVERSSPQSEIKAAYRALQKRCHPDVAGASGHDMAIVLNEVYSLLSDPTARFAYDQEQAKQSEFRGYTGKPLYSAWFGGEGEERAVFVDELRCVGCLKCALYSNKTFAVESVYGRARVVAQWADPEDKIVDAIHTCPVDCISMVQRSDLAALEFLMSKQPRGRVRISESTSNTVGARTPNIFAEVERFQRRFREMKDKSARRESTESEAIRQSRTSAVQAIRSISNWLYWRPFSAPATTVLSTLRLLPPPSSTTTDPLKDRLKEAAARRKAEGTMTATAMYSCRDDYWTPHLNLPSSASPPNAQQSTSSRERKEARGATISHSKRVSIDITAPLVMAVISAAIVGSRSGEMAGVGLQEHVGGAVALGVVNSFELQVLLAGVTWFIIGAAVAGLVQLLERKKISGNDRSYKN